MCLISLVRHTVTPLCTCALHLEVPLQLISDHFDWDNHSSVTSSLRFIRPVPGINPSNYTPVCVDLIQAASLVISTPLCTSHVASLLSTTLLSVYGPAHQKTYTGHGCIRSVKLFLQRAEWFLRLSPVFSFQHRYWSIMKIAESANATVTQSLDVSNGSY